MRYWANFWSWSLCSLDKDSETGALRHTADACRNTHRHRDTAMSTNSYSVPSRQNARMIQDGIKGFFLFHYQLIRA